MPRTIRMRPRKNKSKSLKVDKECRKGRTYEDFLKFIEENPDSVVCEGDSVEGVNDSRSVTEIFERLYIELRPDDEPHQFIFKGEARKQKLL